MRACTCAYFASGRLKQILRSSRRVLCHPGQIQAVFCKTNENTTTTFPSDSRRIPSNPGNTPKISTRRILRLYAVSIYLLRLSSSLDCRLCIREGKRGLNAIADDANKAFTTNSRGGHHLCSSFSPLFLSPALLRVASSWLVV